MTCGPRANDDLSATSPGVPVLRFPAQGSGSAEHGVLPAEMPGVHVVAGESSVC